MNVLEKFKTRMSCSWKQESESECDLQFRIADLEKRLNEKTAECERIEKAANRLQRQNEALENLLGVYREKAADLGEIVKSDLLNS